MFTFACLGLLFLLACVTSAASIRGTRDGRGAKGENLDDLSLLSEERHAPAHGGARRYLLTRERRLIAHEGVMRTLIIRVTDGDGKQPFSDARRESDTWFGTYSNNLSGNANSMASLYDQCSSGKLNFVPATHSDLVNGVLELTIPDKMTGLGMNAAGELVRAQFNALNPELGIEFDAFSIILPEGVTGNGGIAGKPGQYQYYGGTADQSLEVVMHEFGHNIGFHHSGVAGEGTYDDNHDLMGCCAGAQQMCFNAAKSWYSGWYNDPEREGHVDVSHFDAPGQWWNGDLVGLDDYLTGNFDPADHGLLLRTKGGLYTMFNRMKGVNAGVKAYRDEVVIVQQWGEGGKSNVMAVLGAEQKRYTFSADYYDFDVEFELCEISIPPVVTGPLIEIRGTASQSSTALNFGASRAIDGNLDQTWAGRSVTHTTGDDEDMDPWWALVLDDVTEVEHVRILNRADGCCSHRLSGAYLELYDEGDEIIFSRNLGTADDVEDVYLGKVFTVKKVQVKHHGIRIVSLAEVQLFAPLFLDARTGMSARQPDYARVVTWISRGGEPQISCETSLAPTQSRAPSLSPTYTFQPTIYRAVPPAVILQRDGAPCVFQSNPSNHPDRYKCFLEQTTASNEPGGYFNDDVLLSGEDGCIITVQPSLWSWRRTQFFFQSDSSLAEINACFATNSLLTEVHALPPTKSPLAPLSDEPSMRPTPPPTPVPTPLPTPSPTAALTPTPTSTLTAQPSAINPSIPSDVTLLRDNSPCISQINPSNHPDRYKCFIESTNFSNKPGGHGNPLTRLWGAGSCKLDIRPVTWAWAGNMFIFESSDGLDAINACFSPNTLITDTSPLPTLAPTSSPTTVHTPVPTSPLTAQPTAIKPSIPSDVTLLRDNSLCIFQVNPSNHPDRYKCFIELTAFSNEPGGYRNPSTRLWGANNCKLDVRPVTWAWESNMFIFESSDGLDAINACFSPNTLITDTPITDGVVLKRDSSDCISQINPSNHSDRYKCFIEPTVTSAMPGGHGNTVVPLVGFAGCVIDVRPVTWAWEGNGFIFESSASLDVINGCFVAGQVINPAGADQSDNLFD